MRSGTSLLGLLLLLGELARALAGGTTFPKPLDDIAAGAVLLALGLAGPAVRPAWWAAGWALFTGVMLAALVGNVDAALAAPKPRAGLYIAALSVLTLLGAAATVWWARRR